jgi:hypothetical protein
MRQVYYHCVTAVGQGNINFRKLALYSTKGILWLSWSYNVVKTSLVCCASFKNIYRIFLVTDSTIKEEFFISPFSYLPMPAIGDRLEHSTLG